MGKKMSVNEELQKIFDINLDNSHIDHTYDMKE